MRSVLRRASSVLLAMVVWLALAGQAQAGYIVQPSNGSTVGPSPTFIAYLDSSDTIPLVYVSNSPDMSSYGSPVNEIGSCVPDTPLPGAPNQYTCQPPGYAPSYTDVLSPGTYYWWMTYFTPDPNNYGFPTLQISGPFQFTVAEPTAPTDAYVVSPADAASVRLPVKLQLHAPAGVGLHFYVAYSTDRNSDGSPLGLTVASCNGQTTDASTYYCSAGASDGLLPGSTYYWWAVITTADGYSWIFGPRAITIAEPSSSGSSSSGSSGGHTQAKTALDAPYLPSALDFTGRSVKDTRLSQATYQVSKLLGAPRMVDVACWSDKNWASVSGDSGDGPYTTLGLFLPAMPHWINLSPTICRGIETLVLHRPRYPNRFLADAVETVTHEMVHALGDRNEAQTECYAMQMSIIMAIDLGVPYNYADQLAKLNLVNYASRPPSYQNYSACRDNGAWDLLPNQPSPPWHSFQP